MGFTLKLGKKRRKLLWGISALVAVIGLASFLVLQAMQENIMYFVSPSDVVNAKVPRERSFRLGGLIKKDSFHRDSADKLTVKFHITDLKNEVEVRYHGILPDLFREGESVIVVGKLSDNGVLIASTVLAKHDETYMPKEVKEMLSKQNNP